MHKLNISPSTKPHNPKFISMEDMKLWVPKLLDFYMHGHFEKLARERNPDMKQANINAFINQMTTSIQLELQAMAPGKYTKKLLPLQRTLFKVKVIEVHEWITKEIAKSGGKLSSTLVGRQKVDETTGETFGPVVYDVVGCNERNM
jgi:hypothetical protein